MRSTFTQTLLPCSSPHRAQPTWANHSNAERTSARPVRRRTSSPHRAEWPRGTADEYVLCHHERRMSPTARHRLTASPGGRDVSYTVDFVDVSTVGLESSPVADALAGLRANEARYFANKYEHVFTVDPASEAGTAVERVRHILQAERDIVIA